MKRKTVAKKQGKNAPVVAKRYEEDATQSSDDVPEFLDSSDPYSLPSDGEELPEIRWGKHATTAVPLKAAPASAPAARPSRGSKAAPASLQMRRSPRGPQKSQPRGAKATQSAPDEGGTAAVQGSSAEATADGNESKAGEKRKRGAGKAAAAASPKAALDPTGSVAAGKSPGRSPKRPKAADKSGAAEQSMEGGAEKTKRASAKATEKASVPKGKLQQKAEVGTGLGSRGGARMRASPVKPTAIAPKEGKAVESKDGAQPGGPPSSRTGAGRAGNAPAGSPPAGGPAKPLLSPRRSPRGLGKPAGKATLEAGLAAGDGVAGKGGGVAPHAANGVALSPMAARPKPLKPAVASRKRGRAAGEKEAETGVAACQEDAEGTTPAAAANPDLGSVDEGAGGMLGGEALANASAVDASGIVAETATIGERRVADAKPPSRGFSWAAFRNNAPEAGATNAADIASLEEKPGCKLASAAEDRPESSKGTLGGKAPITCSPAMSEALDEVMEGLAPLIQQAGKEEEKHTSPIGGKPEGKAAAREGARHPAAKPAGIVPVVAGKKAVLKDHAKAAPHEVQLKPTGRARGPSRLARESRPEDAAPTLGPIPGPSAGEMRPGPAASVPAAKPAEASTPQAGLRTPVLLRNAYSAGLARVFATRTLSNPAPAVTVMEAQESGEQRQMQDSIVYALDGLHAASSLATQRESAAALLDICTTRRGRNAFMADGMFEEAMAGALALLRKGWDGELAVAFGALLLAFSKDASTQGALVRRESMLLLTHLLSRGNEEYPPDERPGSSKLSGPGTRVAKLIQDGAVARGVTSEAAASSPTALAVLTVIGVTDPQSTTSASDALKTALREHGAVAAIVDQIVASKQANESDRSRKLLHLFLMALENCSFACAENEAYVVGLPVRQDGGDGTVGACLVNLVDRLDKEQGSAVEPRAALQMRECLHRALSVIMNISHHNDAGCQQVVEAGILPLAGRLLLGLKATCSSSRAALLASVDAVSMAMGVLINVVEGWPQAAVDLADSPLPDGSRLLPLLCFYMQEFSPSGTQAEAGSDEGEEVTADELHDAEDEGRASIVQVYAALLLGLLLAPGPQLRAEVAAELPCGSIAPVVEGVKKCVDFYLTTGSITEKTEQSLRNLLATLESS